MNREKQEPEEEYEPGVTTMRTFQGNKVVRKVQEPEKDIDPFLEVVRSYDGRVMRKWRRVVSLGRFRNARERILRNHHGEEHRRRAIPRVDGQVVTKATVEGGE